MKASLLPVLALLGFAAALPLEDIFKRGGGGGSGGVCWSSGEQGQCGKPKDCKGISTATDDCGGHGNQCCVELVCKVPAGTGYCSSVKNGGCPGGQFSYSDGSSEWPCSGGDIQCCIPKDGGYSPDSTNNNSGPSPSPTSSSPSHTSSSSPPSPTGSPPPTQGGQMPRSAIDMLKQLEGFRGSVYKDQVGVETIGYGHNCVTAPGTCEQLQQPISEQQGEDLMMKDLEQFEKCVCALPNASKLNSNQFGALVSFAFNTGCGGTLNCFKAKMSAGDFTGIGSSIPTENTLGGILDTRRQAEAKLFCQPSTTLSGC